MKKILINYGGVVLFYLVILISLFLLNTPINHNNHANDFLPQISQK